MAKDQTEKAEREAPRGAVSEEGDRVIYKPRPGVHITQAGNVAQSNWVGRYGNRTVRVYRGAQAGDVPEAVISQMSKDGVKFGKITMEELGLAPPPGRGAQIISVE